MTDLKDKAVNIKGKQYILVKDRIAAFNEEYPDGQIQTELVSHEDGLWIVKATVWPKWVEERCFVDYSQAREDQSMVNKTAALENASTSAIGRCLALLGIGVIDSVASADEMRKAGADKDPLAKVRLPGEKVSHASPEPLQDTQMAQDVEDSLSGVEEHLCPLHDVPMKERFVAGGNGHYWDHRRQNEEGNWEKCAGQGWRAQRQRSLGN